MYKRTFHNGYFHVYSRGNHKQNIFLHNTDYARFLFLILHCQSPLVFENISRHVSYFVQHRMFNISIDEAGEVIEERYVELINFTLMPNHFHMTLFEKKDGGISKYMQRVLNGYTKYHNAKYEKVGHLFQGPFKAKHIEHENQLTYLSAYIHRNPREIPGWKNKEENYPWSSFQDYTNKNRWGKLLKTGVILDGFDSPSGYKTFVEKSGAKLDKFEYAG